MRLQLRRPFHHRRQNKDNCAHVNAFVGYAVHTTDESAHERFIHGGVEQNMLKVGQKAHVIIGRPMKQQRHPNDDMQGEEVRIIGDYGNTDDKQYEK